MSPSISNTSHLTIEDKAGYTLSSIIPSRVKLGDFDIGRVEALDVREHSIPVRDIKPRLIETHTPTRLHLRATNRKDPKLSIQSIQCLTKNLATDFRLFDHLTLSKRIRELTMLSS